MQPQDLIVRCMARREGDVYVAVCLDLTLAAQGATLSDARNRLHAQIADYVKQAFTVDSAHAVELLTRKAPLSHRLAYHVCKLRSRMRPALRRFVYAEALPLRPEFA